MYSKSIVSGIADGVSSGAIDVGKYPGTAAVEIANESNLALQIQLGSITWTQPAWTAYLYPTPQPPMPFEGGLTFTPKAISTQTGSPSASVIINVYGPQDPLPSGYPLSLARLTNIGNGLTTSTTGSVTIVSSALNQPVTTGGLKTILSYFAGAAGIFRVSGYIEFGSTLNSTLTASVTYTDDIGPQTTYFSASGVNSFYEGLLNAQNTVTTPQSLALVPVTLRVAASTNILCKYNDPTGTPNDHIWFVIEQLL